MPGITHTHVQAVHGARLRTAAAVAALVAAFALAGVLALASSGGDRPSPSQPSVSSESSLTAPGVRYDGGPEEGSRGLGDLVAPNPGRPDGGPEEGTRGPGH